MNRRPSSRSPRTRAPSPRGCRPCGSGSSSARTIASTVCRPSRSVTEMTLLRVRGVGYARWLTRACCQGLREFPLRRLEFPTLWAAGEGWAWGWNRVAVGRQDDRAVSVASASGWSAQRYIVGVASALRRIDAIVSLRRGSGGVVGAAARTDASVYGKATNDGKSPCRATYDRLSTGLVGRTGLVLIAAAVAIGFLRGACTIMA